jgi:hypothetical protein
VVLSVRIDLSRLGPSLILAATGAIGACVRPPLPEVCPGLAPGDLVLTEYRGPQTGSYRQWIELYNASDAPIDLAGISLHFEPLDGGEGSRFLVTCHVRPDADNEVSAKIFSPKAACTDNGVRAELPAPDAAPAPSTPPPPPQASRLAMVATNNPLLDNDKTRTDLLPQPSTSGGNLL